MTSSGIGVEDTIPNYFSQDFKIKKASKYIIYTINDDNTQIVTYKKSAPDASYDNFVQDMNEVGAAYAVYDFTFQKKNGAQTTKIFFVSWCPENTKVKKKMLLASSKDALKKKLVGLAFELQASDADDLSEENFTAKCQQGDQ